MKEQENQKAPSRIDIIQWPNVKKSVDSQAVFAEGKVAETRSRRDKF
jgi:hypothetical protein